MVPLHPIETTNNMTQLEILMMDDLDEDDGIIVFGSQLVDKNSTTPYSDATQVRHLLSFQNTINFNPSFPFITLDLNSYFIFDNQ